MPLPTSFLHLKAVSLAGVLVFLTYDGSFFAYHPVLMSIALIFFLSEGFIAARHIRTHRQVNRHLLFQELALMTALAGVAVVWYSKVIIRRQPSDAISYLLLIPDVTCSLHLRVCLVPLP